MISIKNFWKIWQFFSRTYVLYLQEYIDEICSELTTFAVESPTDGVYFINEVKRAEEKIVVKKSISVNFRLILQYENIKNTSFLSAQSAGRAHTPHGSGTSMERVAGDTDHSGGLRPHSDNSQEARHGSPSRHRPHILHHPFDKRRPRRTTPGATYRHHSEQLHAVHRGVEERNGAGCSMVRV